jgi:hypothetical protein
MTVKVTEKMQEVNAAELKILEKDNSIKRLVACLEVGAPIPRHVRLALPRAGPHGVERWLGSWQLRRALRSA